MMTDNTKKSRPIDSYDEYVRRYFPDDLNGVDEPESETNPEVVAAEVGRRALERAVGRLTAHQP
jgi:hypothetical protein